MRFHILGQGSTGSLIAFHLRRVLSHKHDVHIMYRTNIDARDCLQYTDGPKEIHVEYNGSVSVASGFKTESLYEESRFKYNIISDVTDGLRLPKLVFPPSGSIKTEPLAHSQSETSRFRHCADYVVLDHSVDQAKKLEISSLIICCRPHSTLLLLNKLRHRLTSRSTVVLLQNGALALYEELCSSLFQNLNERPHFILASFNHSSWEKRHGHVVHTNNGNIHFGIIPDGRRDFEKSRKSTILSREDRSLNLDDITQPKKEGEDRQMYTSLRNTVAVLLSMTDLQPKWEPISALQVRLRRRLVTNCVINPITALLGCRNGELFGNSAAERLGRHICIEAANVFSAESSARLNVELGDSLKRGKQCMRPLRAETLIEDWQKAVRLNKDLTSSMLLDIQQGRLETDIDYSNGYIVRLGKQYSVYAGVNEGLVEMIKLRTEIPVDRS